MTEVTDAYAFEGRTLLDRDGDKIGKIGDGELSESEERELFTHYDLAYETDAEASAGNGHDVSGPTTDDAMTRSEEELRVGTERRETDGDTPA